MPRRIQACSYAFTKIAARFDPADPTSATAYAGDFYVASALAIVAGIIAFFFVGDLDQECIQKEDVAFMQYLEASGYDMSQVGEHPGVATEWEKAQHSTSWTKDTPGPGERKGEANFSG
ncbi:Glycerophosphodiester transporter [Taphrina deformans PYCC 5710]|uniref:Glycerophosphodiester transporter n=1 Tax=Taphrina deformans (strain PYCC 5710 / ATCC 11124 / CBS 356.35 / IMI 108563 / JCM 9778 / NBRC 8474) TaxID=1097556 RepID=R4XG52_TAPDE|nr:Glycerophosphodiester transporter [Taphrina deformans PYCC 5710]|eukprot:CCG83474.1 Glycerophosphodiester transporter [Taphrina deformans PYCC 5710]